MSTSRTYALWSCPNTGIANQPQLQNVLTIHQDEPSLAHNPPPHMPSSLPFASITAVLYSHMVASRSPSPLGGIASGMALHPTREPMPVGRLGGSTLMRHFSIYRKHCYLTIHTMAKEPSVTFVVNNSPASHGYHCTRVRPPHYIINDWLSLRRMTTMIPDYHGQLIVSRWFLTIKVWTKIQDGWIWDEFSSTFF